VQDIREAQITLDRIRRSDHHPHALSGAPRHEPKGDRSPAWRPGIIASNTRDFAPQSCPRRAYQRRSAESPPLGQAGVSNTNKLSGLRPDTGSYCVSPAGSSCHAALDQISCVEVSATTQFRSRRPCAARVRLPGGIPREFRRTAARNVERASASRSAAMVMVSHWRASI